MSNPSLYPVDFPKQHQTKENDIIHLFLQKDWDALADVVVCRDAKGNVTARFGENTWDLSPLARTSRYKDNFSFELFNEAPKLQLELKLLAYGWLFHKSNKGKCPKFSTLYSRLRDAKVTYKYLCAKGATSLSYLSQNTQFENFKEKLSEADYSAGHLVHIFGGINQAINLEPWLHFSFGFNEKINSKVLASKISSRTQQQTLVIPERLSDEIYGKAIELINDAMLHKSLIAQTEANLQANYLEGKRILDCKIREGARYGYTDDKGNIIDNRKYTTAITEYFPLERKDIIYPLSQKISNVKLDNAADFQFYLGQLITACYIACGAFSGMRDSEIDKLTPDSYYKDTFNGRDYHMLQSHTFKLGNKRETWVTAPIAEKAISLVSTLTESWRKKVAYPDNGYDNTVWCNQYYRYKDPILITTWNKRLQRFCKQFGLIVTKEDFKECMDSNPNSLDKIKKDVVVGEPWPLSTHQFRRSLAFYTIKHRLGTTVALKQQFKHLYLAMTEWYTNGGRLASLRNLKIDADVQQALDAVNAEVTARKIFQHWHSDEPLSGTHGKAIVKMRGDIPYIYSSWETIYQAVKKGTLTLHGTAHSYCKNGYQCDMDGVVMPQFCVDCESASSVIDQEQAEWWRKKHKSLVRYMELEEDISVVDKAHYITQIRAAENVMTDFDMPFPPFEPDLKVTNL